MYIASNEKLKSDDIEAVDAVLQRPLIFLGKAFNPKKSLDDILMNIMEDGVSYYLDIDPDMQKGILEERVQEEGEEPDDFDIYQAFLEWASALVLEALGWNADKFATYFLLKHDIRHDEIKI